MKDQDEIIRMLVRTINAYENKEVLISNQGQAMDGYSALANFVYIAQEARKLKNEQTSSQNPDN